MNKEEHIEPSEKNCYRFLDAEPIFGADIRFQEVDSDRLLDALTFSARETQLTFSGYRIVSGETELYHLSRYPRRRFGPPPSDEQLALCMQTLERYCAANDIASRFQIELPSTRDEVRVVLGLQEGYLEAERQSLIESLHHGHSQDLARVLGQISLELRGALKLGEHDFHSVSELREFIESQNVSVLHSSSEVAFSLGAMSRVVPSEIVTVGPWGRYQEPASLIVAPSSELQKICELAESFHQERFAVEYLAKGKTQMVETRHCADPDPR